MRGGPYPIKYGVADQSLSLDNKLPFLRVDNPTNARVKFLDVQDEVGPYTMGKVIPWGVGGSARVDTSDTSYSNAGIFATNSQIVAIATNEQGASPGISYAPTTNISNTVTISGAITGSVTVTNTINALITNASIAVTGTVSISNASIAITGNVTFLNSQIGVLNAAGTQLAVNSPQVLLGTLQTPANGSLTNATFAVPVGTHAIGIAFSVLGGVGTTANVLTVQGAGGGNYLNITPSGNTHYIVPILSIYDTSVKIFIQNGAPQILQASVIAILDTEAVWVTADPASPLPVQIIKSPAVTVLSVSQASIAAAGSVVILPAVGIGFALSLLAIQIYLDATAAMFFRVISKTVIIDEFSCNLNNFFDLKYYGAELGTNAEVTLNNFAGVASPNVRGKIVYVTHAP